LRLVLFEVHGLPDWGFLDGDQVLSVGDRDPKAIEQALSIGIDGLRSVRARAKAAVDAGTVRFLRPLSSPSKIIGLARNYRSHGLREGDAAELPILFGMVPSALIGPDEPIILPDEANRVDWEVELGIVIGRRGRYVRAADALEHVIGYTIVNDVSARDPEVVAGQLFRAKAFDTFKPIGPCITTVDELGDAADLELKLWVNGVTKQHASTSDLIAGVRRLMEFCSGTFTLEPGDLIASGTPGGTGGSRTPPEFLKDGDRVTCYIEGIGTLENPVRGASSGNLATSHGATSAKPSARDLGT